MPPSLTLATWLVLAFQLYLVVGVVFAVAFAWRGAARVDPAARGATWGFRLLVLPGAVALWPLLVQRWLAAPETKTETKTETDG